MSLQATASTNDAAARLKASVDRVRDNLGTYYSMQHPEWPPFPWNQFPELPTTWLSNNVFVLDDRSVDYAAWEAEVKAFSAYETESFDPPIAYDSFGPDDLWIEILAMTNDFAYLTLHGTRSDKWYQLLSKPTLDPGTWNLGEVIFNSSGTNQLYFLPVPTGGLPYTFYRAKEGDVLVRIDRDFDAGETNSLQALSGFDGQFTISADRTWDADIVVHYKFCGIASNGVDFVSLPGFTNIAANNFSQSIPVVPNEDSSVEFDEPLTLCLVLTNNYVIDPTARAATVYIQDNPGTNEIFSVVVEDLNRPTGIDYHPTNQSLIVSVNFEFNGEPYNFAKISATGSVTNWSGVHGLSDEIKLAVVKETTNGFVAGEMFFGTGVDGVIGKLSANGAVSNLNWVTVTNAFGETLFRGSFYVDRTGIFSNSLIAVTGGSSAEGGEVWQIGSTGAATNLVTITNWQPHLEGVITVTNDQATWGPFAGKVITGAEYALADGIVHRPLTHAVAVDGSVQSFAVGIAPEDFDTVPTGEHLYLTLFNEGQIVKLPQNLLTNYVGDMLVTQEGPQGTPPGLFILRWSPNCDLFNIVRIPVPGDWMGFEHSTFAPINIPILP